MDCTIRVVKTKTLISCAVSVSLFSLMHVFGFLMRWLIFHTEDLPIGLFS